MASQSGRRGLGDFNLPCDSAMSTSTAASLEFQLLSDVCVVGASFEELRAKLVYIMPLNVNVFSQVRTAVQKD